MKSVIRSSLWDKAKVSEGSAQLNLEALMDIFTIILFFLLANQSSMSESPDLQGTNIVLPEGGVENEMISSLEIRVSNEEIMIDGRVVGSVADFQGSSGSVLPDLVQVLAGMKDEWADKRVTVLGDQGVPFIVLHKLMASATEAGFSVVSLVVIPT